MSFNLLTRNAWVNDTTPDFVALYTGPVGSGTKPVKENSSASVSDIPNIMKYIPANDAILIIDPP